MKPSAIFLSIVFLLAAVSCGKEKDNSHVPAGRVAHMTVTQHTPVEWQDTLLECVKCLLPDGRTERMECRYSGTRLTETAVYTSEGTMRERWTYTYSGDRLARQTLTMEGCSAECTFRYEGSRPVGISYRRCSRWQGTRLRTPLCMAGRQRVGREHPGGRHGGAAHGIPIRRYAQPLTPSPRDGTVHLLEPDPHGRNGRLLPHASAAFQRGLPRGGRLRRGGVVHGRVHLRHRRPPHYRHAATWRHTH